MTGDAEADEWRFPKLLVPISNPGITTEKMVPDRD